MDRRAREGNPIPDDERPPECPLDVTDEERAKGYRENIITVVNLIDASVIINNQLAILQKKTCKITELTEITCIDCTEVDRRAREGNPIPDDERPPECPVDVTDEEKTKGYRENIITVDLLSTAIGKISRQVASLKQEIVCKINADDCLVLLPDPSLPLTTRGHYLLFSWVLEETPKVSIYQTTSQLRNPIDALRVISPGVNYWSEYFEPIYKIIGKQYGTYYSEENSREPLVKGWFLDVDEANRFFSQMRTLTKDNPRETDNPRFPLVTNSTVPIVHTEEKIILRKVCYGYYNEGEFLAVHSWRKP